MWNVETCKIFIVIGFVDIAIITKYFIAVIHRDEYSENNMQSLSRKLILTDISIVICNIKCRNGASLAIFFLEQIYFKYCFSYCHLRCYCTFCCLTRSNSFTCFFLYRIQKNIVKVTLVNRSTMYKYLFNKFLICKLFVLK